MSPLTPQDVALHYDVAIMVFAHADEQEFFSAAVLELCQLVMSVRTLPFFPMHSELSMTELMDGLMEGVRATTQTFSSQIAALETLNLAQTAAEEEPEEWFDLDDEVERRDHQEHQTGTGWCFIAFVATRIWELHVNLVFGCLDTFEQCVSQYCIFRS